MQLFNNYGLFSTQESQKEIQMIEFSAGKGLITEC